MDKFQYKVKTDDGITHKGIVEATNIKNAARVLREKGFFIISIKPGGKEFSREVKGSIFSRISTNDKVNFTRQFSTMITAGLPITDALSILEVQASPAMGKIVSDILREVEGGGSLTTALEKHQDVFDQVYIALTRAGEQAGVLDKVLTRLADNLEKQKEFNSKLKGAMVYPAIVVGGMVIVAGIMIIFVIPKLTSIYDEFQAELPAMTKMLLAISRFATSYWWLALAMVASAVVGFRVLSKQPAYRKYTDQFLFRVPIIGKLKKLMVLTEFTRTLGLLVGSGILIVEALNIVKRSLGSSIFERAVSDASSEVERGLPLATALARSDVFPPLLPQMIAVGEETGKLDEVLGKISTYFEQEADVAVRGLTTALEPLIMIVLGVGVGFLIVAVIMPIYNLTSQF